MKKCLYVGILLTTMFVLTGCDEKVETAEQVNKEEIKISPINQTTEVENVSNMNENKTRTPLKLTQEQKEEYHKQYVKIVEKVNEQKLGIQLKVVAPLDEFKTEYWVEPKVFEKRIQKDVDGYLAEERKALNAIQTKKNHATEVNGDWVLEKYIYVSGTLTRIEVIGNFETQYKESRQGQVFTGINKISTQVAEGYKATWEQTSYKASLLDGGQTYSILIEGIHQYNGLSLEKAFTIKFNCDKSGKIY